jgi:Holliday junction resolvase RusA-like endonuclease
VPEIRFFVAGVPQPGGSKRLVPAGGKAGGRPLIVEDCRQSGPWRERVALAARDAYSGPPLAGPLAVEFAFVVARPKGHHGSGRNAATVRPTAPKYPTGRPDCTKLIRAAEDSLKGICWLDDSQIVRQFGSKDYGDRPGLTITIRPLATTPARSTP